MAWQRSYCSGALKRPKRRIYVTLRRANNPNTINHQLQYVLLLEQAKLPPEMENGGTASFRTDDAKEAQIH